MAAPDLMGTLDMAYRQRRQGGLTQRMIEYGTWRGTEEGRLMAFLDTPTMDHTVRAFIGCPPRTEAQQAQLEK